MNVILKLGDEIVKTCQTSIERDHLSKSDLDRGSDVTKTRNSTPKVIVTVEKELVPVSKPNVVVKKDLKRPVVTKNTVSKPVTKENNVVVTVNAFANNNHKVEAINTASTPRVVIHEEVVPIASAAKKIVRNSTEVVKTPIKRNDSNTTLCEKVIKASVGPSRNIIAGINRETSTVVETEPVVEEKPIETSSIEETEVEKVVEEQETVNEEAVAVETTDTIQEIVDIPTTHEKVTPVIIDVECVTKHESPIDIPVEDKDETSEEETESTCEVQTTVETPKDFESDSKEESIPMETSESSQTENEAEWKYVFVTECPSIEDADSDTAYCVYDQAVIDPSAYEGVKDPSCIDSGAFEIYVLHEVSADKSVMARIYWNTNEHCWDWYTNSELSSVSVETQPSDESKDNSQENVEPGDTDVDSDEDERAAIEDEINANLDREEEIIASATSRGRISIKDFE